jgi:hypothetical protein
MVMLHTPLYTRREESEPQCANPALWQRIVAPCRPGIEYGEIVQEAAVALLIYVVIVAVVVGGHYVALRAFRVGLPEWYKPLVIGFAVLAAVAYPCTDAYLSGVHAKRGEGVEVGGWSPLPLGLPLACVVYLRVPKRVTVVDGRTSACDEV